MNRKIAVASLIVLFILLLGVGMVTAQEPGSEDDISSQAAVGTTFTYQGRLTDGSSPANGTYDFRFRLYDAGSGGSQISATTKQNVIVTEGLFTVELDFGLVFDGTALWLDIGVRPGSSSGAYTVLAPRQPLTPAPYAHSLRPGAIVNGSIDNEGILNITNSSGLGGDGLRIESAGDDGVQVSSADYGFYVASADLFGVLVSLAGDDGVYVGSAGDAGVYVDQAYIDGVVVDSAGWDGVQVNTAGENGVEVGSAGWDGVAVLSAGHYAGNFNGDVHIIGNVYKSGGSVKIDHPLNPANKYLYHSFVESPDMKNIYDGVVVLDADGAAGVDLPEWFEALNRDFRYQLTPLGAPAPGLYIAEKIQNNRFKIAGGEPGLEVSWQVTGIRHDPYAEAHRIPVEEDKPVEEKGTYLHPQAYGQPEAMGLAYKEAQARQSEQPKPALSLPEENEVGHRDEHHEKPGKPNLPNTQ